MFFFRCWDLEMDNILRIESVHNPQRSQAPTSCPEKQHSYPHAGTGVFYWSRSLDGGFVCLRVPPASIPVYWARYLPAQRRYSSFWDEWDLNSEFDMDSDQIVLNIGEIDNFCEDGEICGPSEGPEPGVKDRTAKEWDMVHDKMYKTCIEDLCPKSLLVCTLDDTLRFCIGIVPFPSPSLSPTPAMTSVERIKLNQLGKDTGCAVLPPDPMSHLSRPLLLRLFEGIQWLSSLARQENAGKAIPPSQIPAQYWDLNKESPRYLSRRTNPEFTVRIVHWCHEDKSGYEIIPADEKNKRYRLIVYRATDVLHCFRLRGAGSPRQFR